MSKPLVIAFDVFGTVFDMSSINRDDVRNYIKHIHQETWSPLVLPKSWEHLPPHADSAEGIARLRKNFIVVTCSNGPLGLLSKLSKNGGVEWDAIIPLELNKVFKPQPKAYLTVCEVLDVAPNDVMMVTANETFGDLEASKELGMQPMWIRGKSPIKTIVDLAAHLE